MRFRDIKKKKKHVSVKEEKVYHYAGFWSRLLAFVTDVFMIGIPITIIIMIFFGYDQMHSAGFSDALMQTPQAEAHAPNPLASLLQLLLYSGSFILFWKVSGQTPGMKMAGMKIVDAKDFKGASYFQLVIRFISYFLSLFLFGYLWGLFRKDKKMFQDLVSRTTLIYSDR